MYFSNDFDNIDYLIEKSKNNTYPILFAHHASYLNLYEDAISEIVLELFSLIKRNIINIIGQFT